MDTCRIYMASTFCSAYWGGLLFRLKDLLVLLLLPRQPASQSIHSPLLLPSPALIPASFKLLLLWFLPLPLGRPLLCAWKKKKRRTFFYSTAPIVINWCCDRTEENKEGTAERKDHLLLFNFATWIEPIV